MAEQLAAEVARRAETLGVEVKFVRGMVDGSVSSPEIRASEQADLMVVGRSAKMLHRLAGRSAGASC